MTLRTGNLNVLAAELVEPGKPGWEDVIEVFTRALDEEQERGERYAPSVDSVFGDALAPVNLGAWLVYEPGHGLAVWSAEDMAGRFFESGQTDPPPLHWNPVKGAWVPREGNEAAPGVVLVDESVLTVSHSSQSPADSHPQRVAMAPVKKRKPPKRCLWVWRDEYQRYQCDRARSEPHTHTERGAVLVRPWWEGEPRCLGVVVVGRYGQSLELLQCESRRYACKVNHFFYVKTRLDEDAPAKSEPEPQRCLWVWHDDEGYHQCERPSNEDHGHDFQDEISGRWVGRWVVLWRQERPRCLGVWFRKWDTGPKVMQCCDWTADCDSDHPFYAQTGWEDE